MKKIILIILTLTILQKVNAQFSLDHYSPTKLIADEGIDTCSIFVMSQDSSLTIEQSYIYDALGNEIENRRDFQKFSFLYQYDDKGNKTLEFFIPFGEEYYERDTLLYNRKGRLRKKLTFSRDGTESKRNEYDYKKNLIKEERYILKGKLQTRSLYSYDKKKRITKIMRYFKGKHNEDWLHEYDENNNLISFTTISANGDTTLVHKFEYNDRGLRTKHSIFTKGSKLSTVFLTEYDTKGLIMTMQAITGIKNNDEATGEIEKTIYKYTNR
tara:strand:+ start:73 stop:882 length:810 start_codon:yes stop_codon:yes gene_type:complete